jgi:hypothetical protein
LHYYECPTPGQARQAPSRCAAPRPAAPSGDYQRPAATSHTGHAADYGGIDAMSKLPTIGRIVTYHFDEHGERRARPAVVVDVSDAGVELYVFFSATDPGPGPRLVGIVEGSDEPGLGPVERKRNPKDKPGALEPCWCWPKIETKADTATKAPTAPHA